MTDSWISAPSKTPHPLKITQMLGELDMRLFRSEVCMGARALLEVAQFGALGEPEPGDTTSFVCWQTVGQRMPGKCGSGALVRRASRGRLPGWEPNANMR